MNFDIAQACHAAGTELQDRVEIVERDDSVVVIVADGAGGQSGAAEAATLVVKLARQQAKELTSADECVKALRAADAAIARSAHGGETTGLILVATPTGSFGASVGDSAAWWFATNRKEELTASQRRKPFLGSGAATPTGFTHLFATGTIILATDGLWKYTSLEKICTQAIRGTTEEVVGNLLSFVRLPSGALPDDFGIVVCRNLPKPVRTAVYLTDPAEMRRARSNQPRQTWEQALRQQEVLREAADQFSAEAEARMRNDPRSK